MKTIRGIGAIAQNEFLTITRDKVVWVFTIIIWSMIGFAAYTGWQMYSISEQQKEQAGTLFLQEWEQQHANPHSAAHFGTYLFKPFSVLSAYDFGLTTYLGINYRVEAHKQHELNQASVQQSDMLLRFGEFSVAFVFQFLISLGIFLITHNAISKERQNGTLKMLQLHGMNSMVILIGKIVAYFMVVSVVALVSMLLLAIPLLYATNRADILLRYSCFILLYSFYFLLLCGIGVLLSAWFKHGKASLATGIGCWILVTILLPKIFTSSVAATGQLPSRYELNRNISLGNRTGIGKDGTLNERYEKYLKQTLDKYNVDSVQNLPVNFDGLAMQFGEDYNTKVYNHFTKKVEKIMLAQQVLLEKAALVNPFIAVQQLSMGLAATDYYHHLSFYNQAQLYRNDFIRTLNMDLANSGSEYLSYSYQVGPEFFKKMKQFKYMAPTVSYVFRCHAWSIISMLIWGLLIYMVLLPLTAQQMKY